MPSRTVTGYTHAGQAAARKREPGRAPVLALAAVCLGFFVIQLDVTIVNVALPTIQRDIGGTVAGLQWVLDAYTLVLAAVMLTAGSMADRFGARRVFLAGLAAFAVGSAACAAAPDLGGLIAARAVQGLGASTLLPCSLSLIVHQFPDPAARARALGVWGGMGALGVALGPVLGGGLIALASWRAIFLVNVPVCLLTGWLLVRYVTESQPNPDRRADIPGLVLGVAALAGITAAFIEAGREGWLAPLPGALGGAGLLAAVGFVWAERRHGSPMLPLRLFRSRPFSTATGVGVLFNLSLYGALICISLYLQQGRHESALATGLLILPFSLVVGAGSTVSGWLTGRAGPRWPMITGLGLAAAGAALLSLVGPGTSLGLLLAGSIVLGLVSLAMPAMTAVVVGSAGREHSGVASGVLNTARQAGGALGVALLGALLAGGAGGGGAAGGGGGHVLALRTPMIVAAAALVLAAGLSWLATRPTGEELLPGGGYRRSASQACTSGMRFCSRVRWPSWSSSLGSAVGIWLASHSPWPNGRRVRHDGQRRRSPPWPGAGTEKRPALRLAWAGAGGERRRGRRRRI